MLAAGVVLGLVAIGRVVVAFALLGATATGNATSPAVQVIVVTLTLAVSVAYLGWLAARGRHELQNSPVAGRTRNTLICYGVFARVIVPLVEAAIYR